LGLNFVIDNGQYGEGDLDLYKQASDALNDYFIPKRNKEYDIYKFRQSKQEPGESIDTYHTKLRKLAENCEFATFLLFVFRGITWFSATLFVFRCITWFSATSIISMSWWWVEIKSFHKSLPIRKKGIFSDNNNRNNTTHLL
jgi:hypothetical protein